jgi:hypothetical protein
MNILKCLRCQQQLEVFMSYLIPVYQNSMQKISAGIVENALRAVNDKVSGRGLVLSDAEAQALVLRREEVLQERGRVEFGEGILPKLAFAFCDSPYISQREYPDTLAALMEIFYGAKAQSGERWGDADLLEAMKTYFDGECHGSVEMLADVLNGYDPVAKGEAALKEEGDGDFVD